MDATAVPTPDAWSEAFAELKDWVDSHEQVELSERGMHVPVSVRGEYDAVLEKAARVLAGTCCRGKLGDALVAVSEFKAVEADLIAKTNLCSIKVPDRLRRFIDDPLDALACGVRSALISALLHGQRCDELGAQVRQNVVDELIRLTRSVYEAWSTYAIVDALEPLRIYQVFSPDTLVATAVLSDFIEMGSQKNSPERRLPEAVVETAKGTFAYKFEVATELDYYRAKILRRRDSTAGGDTVGVVGHRALLLYAIKDRNHIPILTDRQKAAYVAPDLMIEHLTADEVQNDVFFYRFLSRVDLLEPRCGSCVLLDGTLADGVTDARVEQAVASDTPERPCPRFTFADVGYDLQAIKAVVEPLLSRADAVAACVATTGGATASEHIAVAGNVAQTKSPSGLVKEGALL